MNKVLLEQFINKYNLGGTVEAVTLVSDADGSLATTFISEDKSLVGYVKANDIGIDEGSYSVYDTAKLRSLLAVLDDDLRVKVNKIGSKVSSLLISDGKTKVTFILADPTIIPKAPNIKAKTAYDLTVTLDNLFITTFIKSKNALPEVNTFVVTNDGGLAEVILGYSNNNINKVAFAVQADQNKSIDLMRFSANDMREILSANKEATAGTLELSNKGLAKISFTVEGFEINYYLVQSQLED